MLRVSTTSIEAYRRLVQTEYGKPEELIAQIKGAPFVPSWQMEAGTAWHACIEGKGTGTDFIQSRVNCFRRDAVELARKVNGPGTWEVKATKQWSVNGRPVNVVAQADHVHGLAISDNKTKFSQVSAKDYEGSIQWRFYLRIHDCLSFQYHCWEMKDPDGGGYCELKGVQSFRFWDYPGMEADCYRWLVQFLSWAESKSLLPYLEREGSTVDVAA